METLLAAIGRASLHGAVAITAVWIVCRLFPRLPASLRCGLWWLACLKLLVALVWVEPVSLAVLPAAEVVAPVGEVERRLTPGHEVPGLVAAPGEPGFKPHSWGAAHSPATSSPGVRRRPPIWPLALAGLWGAGLLLQLGLTVRQLAAARRVVQGAEPVSEPWIMALFADLRERLGVGRARLLASPEVETPQVSGAWRPRVLLPQREIGRLSPQELALTLAHELLHVRRGDLWLGWVPALAHRLFFFHPLAALAAREYALAREAACDAAVLRALDPAPEAYGRLLLRLGVTSRVPRLAAAGAAPTFQTLKRRLEMLQQSADKKRVHRGWWGLLALLALAVLIPIQIVAQAPPPEPPDAVEPAEPVEPVEPVEPAEPVEPVKSAEPAEPAEPGEPVPVPPVRSALPVPPVPVAQIAHVGGPPPVPPAPPAPPVPPTPPAKSWSDDDEPWVLLHDEKSVTMSGSGRDVRDARKHYSGKPLLWFERDGKTYVIKDQATVARAQKLFEPQRNLGEQQGALGEKQAKLGEKQAELGAQMGQYGARTGALAAQQASHAVAGHKDQDHDSSLDEEMDKLSEQMEALGRQIEELGRQQEALGRQQEELGRQQEKIAREGERQLKSLLDQAMASGLAQEVGG